MIVRLWIEAQLIAKRPDIAGSEAVQAYLGNWTSWFSGVTLITGYKIGEAIMYAIDPDWNKKTKEEQKEIEKERDAILREVGVDPMIEKIFVDWFFYGCMAVPALFILLEFKNYKQRKRAKGMLK